MVKSTRDDFDHGHRIASLETEMRSMREEVQLGRRRYHEMSNALAPLLHESTDILRDIENHDRDIRELRSALDSIQGVWKSIVVGAVSLSAVATGAWALITHFRLF